MNTAAAPTAHTNSDPIVRVVSPARGAELAAMNVPESQWLDPKYDRFRLEHRDDWACPITGIKVPKTVEANARFRRAIAEHAYAGPRAEAFREHQKELCKQSWLYWLNCFGWTYVKHHVLPNGEQVPITTPGLQWQPFITWPVQDWAGGRIIECVRRGEIGLIDKSRDMGATWLVLAAFTWMWQFHKNLDFLLISRKEEYVDYRGSPRTLFWKIDQLVGRQPAWLRPKVYRKHLQIINEDCESTIEGESSTENVGQGDRRSAFMVDEASRFPNLEAAENALADTAASGIYVSTPNGPTRFSSMRSEFPTMPKRCVIVLGYWSHPHKGAGRKLVKDDATGKVYWSTPWFERERYKRSQDGNLNDRPIAENLLIDHLASGSLFFSIGAINRQREMAMPADHRGEIVFLPDHELDSEIAAIQQGEPRRFGWMAKPGGGRWELWCPLVADQTGKRRPPQNTTYVFGIDVARGTGASDSVISVFDVERGMKVGQYVCNKTGPYDLAVQAGMAAWWFGGIGSGRGGGVALVNWETNGSGTEFTRFITRFGVPWLYYRDRIGQHGEEETKQLGWHSSGASKPEALGDYNEALIRGEFVNPSAKSLDQAAEYVYLDSGGSGLDRVGPAKLKDKPASEQRQHGDIVIADMLAWMAARSVPRIELHTVVPPATSFARQYEAHEGKPFRQQ